MAYNKTVDYINSSLELDMICHVTLVAMDGIFSKNSKHCNIAVKR